MNILGYVTIEWTEWKNGAHGMHIIPLRNYFLVVLEVWRNRFSHIERFY